MRLDLLQPSCSVPLSLQATNCSILWISSRGPGEEGAQRRCCLVAESCTDVELQVESSSLHWRGANLLPSLRILHDKFTIYGSAGKRNMLVLWLAAACAASQRQKGSQLAS